MNDIYALCQTLAQHPSQSAPSPRQHVVWQYSHALNVSPVTYAWFVVQITVAAASGRRHLLRKDLGMQPVKIIPATPNPVQPAFNTKSRRGKATQARSEVTPWRGNSVAKRQLASTCTSAISDTIYGDINFDCEFTFVQVTSYCLLGHPRASHLRSLHK